MDNLLERLEKMNAVSEYIKEKMKIYIKALNEISQADDQANPIALRNKARIALVHEPTTADKFNKDIVHGPNDPGDEHKDKDVHNHPEIIGRGSPACVGTMH